MWGCGINIITLGFKVIGYFETFYFPVVISWILSGLFHVSSKYQLWYLAYFMWDDGWPEHLEEILTSIQLRSKIHAFQMVGDHLQKMSVLRVSSENEKEEVWSALDEKEKGWSDILTQNTNTLCDEAAGCYLWRHASWPEKICIVEKGKRHLVKRENTMKRKHHTKGIV